MTIDPTTAWAVVVDGKIKHIRLTKGIAEASASIERIVYGESDVKVKPFLLTEVENEVL